MAPEPQTIVGFRVHPDANLFPIMEGEGLEELSRSIQTHGLREPIKILDHQILDGRNRALALELMGAKRATMALDLPGSKFTKDITLPAGMTAAEYVAIENLHRRHLTAEQRKRLAGEIAVRIKQEQSEKPKAQKIDALGRAASAVGVSRRTVARGIAEIEGKPKPSLKSQTVTTGGLIVDAVAALEARKSAPKQAPKIDEQLRQFHDALRPYLDNFVLRLLDECRTFAERQFALSPDADPAAVAEEAWAKVERVLGGTDLAA